MNTYKKQKLLKLLREYKLSLIRESIDVKPGDIIEVDLKALSANKDKFLPPHLGLIRNVIKKSNNRAYVFQVDKDSVQIASSRMEAIILGAVQIPKYLIKRIIKQKNG